MKKPRIKIGAHFDGLYTYLVAASFRLQGVSSDNLEIIKKQSVKTPTRARAIAALADFVAGNNYRSPEIVFSISANDVIFKLEEAEAETFAGYASAFTKPYVTSQEIIRGGVKRVLNAAVPQEVVNDFYLGLAAIPHKTFTLEFSFTSLIRTWKVTKPSLVVHINQDELFIIFFNPELSRAYHTRFDLVKDGHITKHGIEKISGEIHKATSFWTGQGDKFEDIYLSGIDSRILIDKFKDSMPVNEVPDAFPKLFQNAKEYRTALGALLRSEQDNLKFAFAEGVEHKAHLKKLTISGFIFLMAVALLLFLIIPALIKK